MKTNNPRPKLAEITAIILVALMTTCVFTSISSAAVIPNSMTATPLSPTTNYGNVNQYEWTTDGGDETYAGFSAGPGPDTPDVLWQTNLSGAAGVVNVFDGLAFVASGSTLNAYDAMTGQLQWKTTLLAAPLTTGGATKINDQYMFVVFSTPNGLEVLQTSTGASVANFSLPYYATQAGSGEYFPGAFSSSLKMQYLETYNNDTYTGYVNAVSLADPTHPTVVWNYTLTAASEIMGFGAGTLFVGNTQDILIALNGTTGAFLWQSHKIGEIQQSGFYYAGNFYQSAASLTMTCWNATTGKIQWQYDANALGTRAFFAYRGAAAYGRVYSNNDASTPNGWVCCWDATTGNLLWKQPGYYQISYTTPVIADGKLYTATCDQPQGSITAGEKMPGYSFTCFDAYTGEELWTIPQEFSQPSIAYGNLYGVYGGVVYCIGQTTPALSAPWSFGFIGNLNQPRIAIGQSGPTDFSHLKWVYATEGRVSSSPAVANGMVYIGSDDRNLYCLNAYTGAKIWNFTTGYAVGASPAVVNGIVYTGADDGNIYALDANTGKLIWQTSAGGLFTNYMFPQELQSRSSPIVVGSNLYVGALDDKVYCLSTSNGNIQWTYTTGGPIGGSPVYTNGIIYITSTDTSMYALNAATGALVWRTVSLGLGVFASARGQLFNTATPIIVNGQIFVAAGATFATKAPGQLYTPTTSAKPAKYLADFNATNGALIWKAEQQGNTGSTWLPVYANGILYVSENFQVTARNATNGNLLWAQWIGYQILSSVAYANDLRGPLLYITSDVGSVTCLNGTNGAPLSAYETGANVEGSVSIWQDKIYVGGTDENVYCFDDSPILDFSINAAANKGSTMWNNETLTIAGTLVSNPDLITFSAGSNVFETSASDMHPGLPNATINVSLVSPDQSSINLTTVTDNLGNFNISYNPTTVGQWNWIAYYAGQRTIGITYNPSYTQYGAIEVTVAPIPISTPTPSPTASPTATPSATVTPTQTPTATAKPVDKTMIYVYIAIAVIVIIVAAISAYVYTKRKKKQTQ